MKARRALVILNGERYSPSAMVRAYQFKGLFETSSRWRGEFVSRQLPDLRNLVLRTSRPRIPLMMPLVNRPARAYLDFREQRNEDEIVEQARDYDLVYLVKVPHLPLYRRVKQLGKPKVVMEMHDAIWLPLAKGTWSDLDEIIATSDAVICENGHVANYARQHNPHAYVVPDSPQLHLFDLWRSKIQRDPEKIVLGWIGGSHSVHPLCRIYEVLEELSRRYPRLHLRIVGVHDSYLPRFETARYSNLANYDQETMVREALAMDIGLFPLFHNEDARSRGTLKAMIPMSAEAAVIAENVGENPRLIRDGVNGLLAASPSEWLQKLEWLIINERERKDIARRGLDTIRQQFDAPIIFKKLLDTFDAIVESSVALSPADFGREIAAT
jgi:glycosyltransferase involved in cell wall biosynthesis